MKRKEPCSPDNTIKSMKNIDAIDNPIKMSRPDAQRKDEKYDRQLRLWGHNGQWDLESSNICLINATATGTEALKCLILPGIGRYTIVDNTNVSVEDISNNFFLEAEAMGKPKAKVACDLLQELNTDSIGSAICQDAVDLLENDPEFFKKFTIVIASHLSERSILRFGNLLWHANIPFVVCDNFGMLGYLRLVVKEHAVIEAHPDNVLEDLRLDCPFTEFVQYMENIKLEEMDKLEHSHTPYLVIIYKYLEQWRENNNRTWPKTYKEKCEIKNMIRGGIRKNEHGVEETEENFEEAIMNVNSVLTATNICNEVKQILNDLMANHPLNSDSNSKFWILVRALKEFVNQTGHLPLRGSLPDMFSDSRRYIELQSIYKAKAASDVQMVEEFVREILQDLQLPPSFISIDDVEIFCRNASFLRVERGLSFHDEFKQDGSNHKMNDKIEMMPESCAHVYFVVRALSRFRNNGCYPGMSALKRVADLEACKKIAEILIEEIGMDKKVPVEYLEELFRCNVRELHTASAVMGGICAQEVIKIITKQFVPVDNTFIYNGITQTTTSIKL